MSTRKYDLVLFGATGITGGYTADYLASSGPKNLKWALAGRSIRKLEDVKRRLVSANPACEELDLLIADAFDVGSLDEVTKQAKVILTTVGPFTKYGMPLVDSCIRNDTHYIDSTGEAPFVKEVIDKYHEIATAKGIILVPCSGFDSVPSDLGAFYVVEQIKKRYGKGTDSIKFSLTGAKGGVSGGTLASFVEVAPAKDALFDPYLLSPTRGTQKSSIVLPTFDYDLGRWQAYYLMSSINEKIVQRSASLRALAGQPYGKNFKYSETMSYSLPGALGATVAFMFAPLFSYLLKLDTFKSFIQRLLPSPGTGPASSTLKEGFYEIRMIGKSEGDHPNRVIARIKAFGDPGYWETCKMLAESALCIIYDKETIPGRGGVLTPATAFGETLLGRLRNVGQIWEVYEL